MVDDISAEYENSIARISQDSKIEMIAAEFEKQGFAPEVDRDLERVSSIQYYIYYTSSILTSRHRLFNCSSTKKLKGNLAKK